MTTRVRSGPDTSPWWRALRVSATKITFEDDPGGWKVYGGSRGSRDRTEVERTSRRTLRYTKLIRDSAEFKRAVAEHDRGDSTTR